MDACAFHSGCSEFLKDDQAHKGRKLEKGFLWVSCGFLQFPLISFRHPWFSFGFSWFPSFPSVFFRVFFGFLSPQAGLWPWVGLRFVLLGDFLAFDWRPDKVLSEGWKMQKRPLALIFVSFVCGSPVTLFFLRVPPLLWLQKGNQERQSPS